MQYQIVKNPMSILEVQMGRGEIITAESGAMVFMKGRVWETKKTHTLQRCDEFVSHLASGNFVTLS